MSAAAPLAPLTLRRGETRDVPTLVAFNQAMAQETEGKALDTGTLTSGVSRFMARPELGYYLVAERPGPDGVLAVQGSLMVTSEWSDWRDGLFWWIQSVYVRPEARRTGVYRALYAEVQRLARAEQDIVGLRLYVEVENTRAQATYRSLGMEELPYRLYEEPLDK